MQPVPHTPADHARDLSAACLLGATPPRYVVAASGGSLPVVFDTVEQRAIEHGRRFQLAEATRVAAELNAAVAALPPAAVAGWTVL